MENAQYTFLTEAKNFSSLSEKRTKSYLFYNSCEELKPIGDKVTNNCAKDLKIS